MSLQDRLAALQQQRGAASVAADASPAFATPAAAGNSPLVERLQRLSAGAHGRVGIPPPDVEIAAHLDGNVLADGVVIVERDISISSRWGCVTLAEISDPVTAPWLTQPSTRGLLFFDTETTGLAGGTGTLPFLVGCARVVDTVLRVRQYFLTAFRGEHVMLRDLAEHIGADSHLVTYNGKCFDVPLMVARFRMARLDDPFSGMGHLDLVHPMRTAFGRRWPDCRLTTAERQLLGMVRSGDLPGAAMPGVWSDFLRRGATALLPAVLSHNRTDLISLAALLPVLSRAFTDPSPDSTDALAIARAHRRAGDDRLAYRHLAAARQQLDESGLLELARMHGRRGEWRQAQDIWSMLATKGCAVAAERLAIFHEHARRDPETAASYARMLVSAAATDPAHQRRLERLEGKRKQTILMPSGADKRDSKGDSP